MWMGLKMPVVVDMMTIIWAAMGAMRRVDGEGERVKQRRNGIAGPRSGRSDGEGERMILWGCVVI